MNRAKVTILALVGVFLTISSAYAASLAFYDLFKQVDRQRWYVSHGWSNGDHQSCEWRAENVYTKNGHLQLRLAMNGAKVRPVGCAELHTNQRLKYGKYEARMRTAAGSGLNTALFTYIGPPNGVAEHDEIDFEFLGKNPRTVDITLWTNGRKVTTKVLNLGYDASKEFHNYTIEWLPNVVRWSVDGKLAYQTSTGIALPRNAGFMFFSLWSGSKIENDWMGPFSYKSPVTAEVVWAKFTPSAVN